MPAKGAARREIQRRWREANPEKARAATDRWRAQNAERVRATRAQNADNHPAKFKARELARTAKRAGRLVPEPCLFCDDPNTQMHHHDYSQPLVVTWVCPRHHALAHREEAV